MQRRRNTGRIAPYMWLTVAAALCVGVAGSLWLYEHKGEESGATELLEHPVAGPAPTGFSRTSFRVISPTAMAWAPDGRLYVSEIFGRIHAIALTPDGQRAGEDVYTPVGKRLTLGIAVDPASTPTNVILWISHSNPSLTQGIPNTGTVSRLSGPAFATRADVITGLPRSHADHATNAVHFGPDGRLYIAQGGNTGAGAPSIAKNEFRLGVEQPLSAAILVADVKKPGFNGDCNPTRARRAACSVRPFATGLRNVYDFVWAANGQMYAPDNGLGARGTYPPSPTAPCRGHGDPRPVSAGGNDPGDQNDILVRVVAGKYYGHPNPSRRECVFGDGSLQKVAPPPNYEPPILDLGAHQSANGTIQYQGMAACGSLRGDLLLATYRTSALVRVHLASDGKSVVSSGLLANLFNAPVSLAQDPSGRIFVGQLGIEKIDVLTPYAGCWRSAAPLPARRLDAGSATLGRKLYVIAGKNANEHLTTVLTFDPAQNTWRNVPDLPGIGVENPAAVSYKGKLFVFGGSTDAFAGAVTNASAYDPSRGSWTKLAPLQTPRSGATAQVADGRIYVMGGMDEKGTSLATVEVYDPARNSWSIGPQLGTRRDNPGSAVLGGKIYVFGGRTRNADGTTENGTLATVEMLDPGTPTSSWTRRASMPTGRRTFAVGLLNGRAQLIGGEKTVTGGSFSENEEYDPIGDTWRTLAPLPTPRHGTAAGTIKGIVYVVGGGPNGGFSLSAINESFTLRRER